MTFHWHIYFTNQVDTDNCCQVTYDLHQLDTTARQSLRDSLINQLIHLKSGPSVLITQICLTLNALAMQLPSWVDVVPQMIKLLGTDAEAAPCLLEFLTVLPEEVNGNYRIPITVSCHMNMWLFRQR